MPMPVPRPGLSGVRRFLRRHRRPVAAALAGGAVLAGLAAVVPGSPPTVDVVVAASSIPPGERLDPAQLRVVATPAEAVPPGSFADPADLSGRIALTGLAAGEPVTATRLLDSDRSAGQGRVALPLRLSDAETVLLLAPGDIVDVLAADAGKARVIARDARVMTVPRRASTGLLGSSGSSAPGGIVMLSVTPEAALDVAAAAGRISVVLR